MLVYWKILLLVGWYAYFESSAPAVKGDIGQYLSEEFKVNPNFKWCLSFWYHMYGNGVGGLQAMIK